MSNDVATLDTNNYSEMAKLMGLSGDEGGGEKSTLARLKVVQEPIMGAEEVKGKTVKVEVIPGGWLKLEVPEGEDVYGSDVTFRPFVKRVMRQRFVQADKKKKDSKPYFIKTLMADSTSKDLMDTEGTYNCGIPSEYIQDFNSLPESQQALIRATKRTMVMFGELTINDPHDAAGNPVDFDSAPCVFEVKNNDSFKAFDKVFKDIAKKKQLPIRFNLTLEAEEKEMPRGIYYVVTPACDLSSMVDIDESTDGELLRDFLEVVQRHNEWVKEKFYEANSDDEEEPMSDEDADLVGEYVTIDNDEEFA